MAKQKTVESYISDHPLWSSELKILRQLVLETELEETLKWGMPVYTIKNKNVIGVTGFKKFFGIWFYQGSFLSDPKKVLRNAQEGKTKGMRHLNFTHKDEIDLALVRAYVKEAIANEKAGKRISVSSKKVETPPLLVAAFKADKKLKTSFDALTKGRQNDYKDYIVSAKREVTKEKRLEKIIPLIFSGVGLNDKYK